MTEFDLFWSKLDRKAGSRAKAETKFIQLRLGPNAAWLAERWNQYVEDCREAEHMLCHVSTWLHQKRYHQDASDFFTRAAPNLWETPLQKEPDPNSGLTDEQAAEVRKTHLRKALLQAQERMESRRRREW